MEEDEEALKKELKNAFEFYDKVFTSRQSSEICAKYGKSNLMKISRAYIVLILSQAFGE